MDKTAERSQLPIRSRGIDMERVALEIQRLILATGRFSSGQVDVTAWDDTVRLRGRVRTYYQKQLAQAAALSVAGFRRLENEVEVA